MRLVRFDVTTPLNVQRLTDKSSWIDRAVWINPEQVVAVEQALKNNAIDPEHTCIVTTDSSYFVNANWMDVVRNLQGMTAI